MASHAETGALPGMDLEFGPIPFSFPSTQPVHMTYEVQDYARKEAGHMPYIKMNYLGSYFNPFFHYLWICLFIYAVSPFSSCLFFACERSCPLKMPSHGKTGALARMDSEFRPIPFFFLSTQPVHMTYEEQDYARKEPGHMPYIKMNYLCSYFDLFFHHLLICLFIYEVPPFFSCLFFACEGPCPSKMASHGETGALAGMDAEFGPITFSFLSTQPVHMTYQVQDYVRKEAGHMPYIKMNYLCSYFNPFFHHLWICLFIYAVTPFTSCLFFACFSF